MHRPYSVMRVSSRHEGAVMYGWDAAGL
jgi:hypothetical protein